ncbi:hypothetical protein BH20ACI1_BH20ACI1_17030 [soil metagenome]
MRKTANSLTIKNLLSGRKRLFIFLLMCVFGNVLNVSAHQQPTTIVLLDVNPNNVNIELQIPLTELELAFGNDVAENPAIPPKMISIKSELTTSR